MTHKRLSSIDLMKFLCAVLVVGIHTEPFTFSPMLDNAFGILTRIAVPFFFIASSYLFFLKPLSLKRLGRFVKRIFILYLVWSVIYALFDWLYLAAPVNSRTFFDFFIYGFKHFWYLQATIVSVGLCSLMLYVFRNKKWIVYAIVGFLYIWGTLNSTYSNLLPFEEPLIRIIGARNGVYYAPLFIMIGYAFSQQKKTLSVIRSSAFSIAMFCILAVESGLSVLVLKVEQTILWFSTPALMCAIFAVVSGVRIAMPDKLSSLLRKVSIGIYCIHPIWISIFTSKLGYGIPLFFVVLCLSIIVSLVIHYVSQKISLLKHLL